MISKKTLAVTAFALLLSQQSFASETEGFYFGSGYYGQYLNNTSVLKTSTTGIKNLSINDRGAQNTEGQSLSEYKGDYNPPLLQMWHLVTQGNWVTTAIGLNWKGCILL